MKRFFLVAAAVLSLNCLGNAQVPDSVMHPDLNVDLPVWEPSTGGATLNIHVLGWDSEKHGSDKNQLVIDRAGAQQNIIDFFPDADGNASFKVSLDGATKTWFHTATGTIGRVWLKGGETVDVWLFPGNNDKIPMEDFIPQALTNGEYALYSYINGMPEFIQAMDAEWKAGFDHMHNPKMSAKAYTNMIIAHRQAVKKYLAEHPELPKAVRQRIDQWSLAGVDAYIANPVGICEYTLPPGYSLTFTELTPKQIARIRAAE